MIYEGNKIELSGEICSLCSFNHEKYGENFYNFYVSVKRNSNNIDIIPIIVSEKIIDISSLTIDKKVKVFGSVRTFNERTEKSRLKVYVHAEDIIIINDNIDDDLNSVNLEGYICKKTEKRKTPLGRVITDVILAVNRPFGKSDYIPCVFWGKNANYVDQMDIGDYISIHGRMQSREYIKNGEIFVVYELSVQQLELINEFLRG